MSLDISPRERNRAAISAAEEVFRNEILARVNCVWKPCTEELNVGRQRQSVHQMKKKVSRQ